MPPGDRTGAGRPNARAFVRLPSHWQACLLSTGKANTMETTRAGGAETREGCRCHLCRPLTLPQILSLRPPVETLHHLGPLLTPRHGGLLGKGSGLGCVNLSPDDVMVSSATSIFTRKSSHITELESGRREGREGVGLSHSEGSANGPGSHAHGSEAGVLLESHRPVGPLPVLWGGRFQATQCPKGSGCSRLHCSEQSCARATSVSLLPWPAEANRTSVVTWRGGPSKWLERKPRVGVTGE